MTSPDLGDTMNIRYDLINSSSYNEECRCTTKHIPRPLIIAVVTAPEGAVVLCPTSLLNLELLLKEYDLTDGRPDGSVTKHYGKFIRDLAERIYLKGA